jgi:hypothetical protein
MRLKDQQGSGVDGSLSRSWEIWPTEFAARAPTSSQNERKFVKSARADEDRDANEPAARDDRGRRLWPFDVEALCAKARRTTGLEDFGEPIERALSVLADSLEREAALHHVGRFLVFGQHESVGEEKISSSNGRERCWRFIGGSLPKSTERRGGSVPLGMERR